MGRLLGLAALALAGCALNGCSQTVDDFSGRVVNFNEQSARAHNQELLLNILRASHNEPLEITSLRDVQGTATITGSASLSAPLAQAGGLSTGLTPLLLETGGSVSGGPIFSLDVLNTQEFYRGFLAPITTQTLDYYMHQGLQRGVLFYLLVREIVISQGTRSVGVLNVADPDVSPEAARNARYFREIIASLVYNNVETEQISSNVAIGPELTPDEVKSLPALVDALGAGVEVVQVSGKPERYRLQKTVSSYRFCIGPTLTERALTPEDVALADLVPPGQRCGATQEEREASGAALGGTGAQSANSLTAQTLPPEQLAAAAQARPNQPRGIYAILPELLPGYDPHKPFNVEFVMRSAQSAIQYLGKVTRAHVDHPSGDPITVPVWVSESGNSDLAVSTDRIGYQPLFVVDAGSTANTMLSVDYRGVRYSIAEDPRHSGNSELVLSLVEQLIALNKSARDLPSSSYLTVTH